MLITLSNIKCGNHMKHTPTLKVCDEMNMYRMHSAWTEKKCKFEHVDPTLFKNHLDIYKQCHEQNDTQRETMSLATKIDP